MKTIMERMNHTKVVKKKTPFGRCYNNIDGVGYHHYTKGFKRRSVKSSTVESGTEKLFNFLGILFPATNEVEEVVDKNDLDENINSLEDLKKARGE